MAANKAKKAEEKPKDTVPGYAGPAADTVAGTPPETKKEMPEGTVIGQGSVSFPTKYETPGAFHKAPTKATRYAGKVLLEGDTFHGNHIKMIAEITEPLTEEGCYNTFRGHHPDAIRDGFKCKPVSDEEAQKLTDEWTKERKA